MQTIETNNLTQKNKDHFDVITPHANSLHFLWINRSPPSAWPCPTTVAENFQIHMSLLTTDNPRIPTPPLMPSSIFPGLLFFSLII